MWREVPGHVSAVAVIPDLSSRDRWAAIREVISRWPALSNSTRKEIKQAVITRERIHSTAVGHSIALSHGEWKGLSSVLVAVGVSQIGIEFAAVDRELVHLLFVFATPPSQRSEYLQVLARICRLGRQEYLSSLWKNKIDVHMVERTLNQALDPLF